MRGGAIAIWAIAAALTVWCAVVMVTVVKAGKAWPGVPMLLLMLAPGLLFMMRLARACARVESRGVLVVNLRQSTFVPWEDIVSFSIGPLGLLPKIGIVELRDGRRIPIVGIQGPNPMMRPNNKSAERLIDLLNDELRRHRHDPDD